jgi:hypothetical protein
MDARKTVRYGSFLPALKFKEKDSYHPSADTSSKISDRRSHLLLPMPRMLLL